MLTNGYILEQVDQQFPRPDFNEIDQAPGVYALDGPDKLHRRDDLANQQFFDDLFILGIGQGRHIGNYPGVICCLEGDIFQIFSQLPGRPFKQRGMKGP